MIKINKRNASIWPVLKLFYMGLVLVVLLTTATYTWFSLSRTPKVHDMTLYISTDEGLKICADKDAPDEEWTLHLNYNDYIPENTVLKPVTWSDSEGRFYAADFGADGRIRGISHALSDERNSNGDGSVHYYVKFTFFAKTDADAKVSLADPDENTGNYVVGLPLWDGENVIHNNCGREAQKAIRIGFRITKFDENGEPTDEDPIFIIYEPNCDVHLDFEKGYRSTESIDGTENLVPPERLIRQTATGWLEAEPVQRDVLIYYYGDFMDETFLFELEGDHIAQIDMYLWLEGQDEDCTYVIGEAAQIVAAIKFDAVSGGNSGFDEID